MESSSSPASPAAAGESPAELGVPGRRSRRWAAPGSSRNRSTSETTSRKKTFTQPSPPALPRQNARRAPDKTPGANAGRKRAILGSGGSCGRVANGPADDGRTDRGRTVTRHVRSRRGKVTHSHQAAWLKHSPIHRAAAFSLVFCS